MNQPSIFNRAGIRSVGQSIASGMAPGQHPRISIRGGAFHLMDASGQRWQAPVKLFGGTTVTLLTVIVGANPVMSKVYYRDPYEQDDTGLPPLCFSDNGVGPSRNAGEKQARTCAECNHSGWGSAVSRVTGRPTKACADKKKLAVLVIEDTSGMCFELQVPPASLKALSNYQQQCEQIKVPDGSRSADVADFVTGISFVPDQTGQLEFQPVAWLNSVYLDQNRFVVGFDHLGNPLLSQDEGSAIAAVIDRVWNSGQVELLTGMKDTPAVAGALPPPPAAMPAMPAPAAYPQHNITGPVYGAPGQPAGHIPTEPAYYQPAQQPVYQPAPVAPGPGYAPAPAPAPVYPQAQQPQQYAAPPPAAPAPVNPWAGPPNAPVAQPVQAFPAGGQPAAAPVPQIAPGAPTTRGNGTRRTATRPTRAATPAAPAPLTAAVPTAPAGPMPPLPGFLQRNQQAQGAPQPVAQSAPAPQAVEQPAPVAAAPQPTHGMVDAPAPPEDISAQIRQAMQLAPGAR